MGAVEWTLLKYLEAGAYIAIMLAVAGVPQMLSSYFDIRARRQDLATAEANAERRHREEAERRREEAELRRQDEERRHQDAERRHQNEERLRQDAERRHHEMMLMMAGVIGNSRRPEQDDLLRTMQGVIDDLRAENERLRNGRAAVDADDNDNADRNGQ